MKKFLKYTGLLGALNLIVAPLTLLILSGCAEEVTEQKSVIPRVKYYVVGESATGQGRVNMRLVTPTLPKAQHDPFRVGTPTATLVSYRPRMAP